MLIILKSACPKYVNEKAVWRQYMLAPLASSINSKEISILLTRGVSTTFTSFTYF